MSRELFDPNTGASLGTADEWATSLPLECWPITVLQAHIEALTAERDALRAAFIKHRTATHTTKPHHCETCRESDAVLGWVDGRPV